MGNMAFLSIENDHVGDMVWPERIDITSQDKSGTSPTVAIRETIAVGDESFLGKVKRQMQALAIWRRVQSNKTGYELKEACAPYNCDFDIKKSDIARNSARVMGEYNVILYG